jgi:hypothetical protein
MTDLKIRFTQQLDIVNRLPSKIQQLPFADVMRINAPERPAIFSNVCIPNISMGVLPTTSILRWTQEEALLG